MSYPKLDNIIIGGKKYIDLSALENAVKHVYPLKTHSLRRLARYGKIPYKRIGMSRKDWFNVADVATALKLKIEDDPNEIDINKYDGIGYAQIGDLISNEIEAEEDYLTDL
jgi:hypothetical protein